MNPALIILWILFFISIPLFAGAFLLGMLSFFDDEILPQLEDDEED